MTGSTGPSFSHVERADGDSGRDPGALWRLAGGARVGADGGGEPLQGLGVRRGEDCHIVIDLARSKEVEQTDVARAAGEAEDSDPGMRLRRAHSLNHRLGPAESDAEARRNRVERLFVAEEIASRVDRDWQAGF